MDKKNFPIGTVCDIRGSAKKIMIIGFVAVGYESDLVKHDYYGCQYPQGVSGISNIIMFDAVDIENVYFTGYETEESNILLNKISNFNFKIEQLSNSSILNDNSLDVVPVMEIKKPIVSNGFIFDEDGYIIKEDPEKLKNPFVQNNIPKTEEPVKENKWDIFKNLKFDENGIVVADGTETNVTEEIDQPVVIPEHHDEIVSTVEVKQAPNNFNNIKFDENGTVISDGIESSLPETVNVPDKFSGIKFDENRTVISDGTETSLPEIVNFPDKFSGIKFDENGTVISDSTESSLSETVNAPEKFSRIKFDENGTVIEDGTETSLPETVNVSNKFSRIKFDENGFIVQE